MEDGIAEEGKSELNNWIDVRWMRFHLHSYASYHIAL